MLALENRLQELSLQINSLEDELQAANAAGNQQSSDKVEQEEVPLSIPRALASQLFVLQSLYTEAKSYLEEQNLPELRTIVNKIESKLNEFDVEYPQVLLSVDFHRKLDSLKQQLDNMCTSLWTQSIIVEKNHLEFNKNANIEFVGEEYALLRETSVRSLDPLVSKLSADLSISKFHSAGHKLEWEESEVSKFDDLANNCIAFVEFVGANAPSKLLTAISKRYGSQLGANITRVALPKLLELNPKPSAEYISELMNNINSALLANKWQKSSELTQFGKNFDSVYADFSRNRYLSQLRQLLIDVSPVSEDKRMQLIKPKEEPEVAAQPEEEKDEWDWNDDEEEEEEAEQKSQHHNDDKNTDVTSKGSIVDLWDKYCSELPVKARDPFITLYRALVPQAYENNHLWIYADTKEFRAYLGETEIADELVLFAHHHLKQYIDSWQERFENEELPLLFGNQQQQQVKELMQQVESIAMNTTEAGGPELRQSVLGRLVEQSVVFVINTVEQNRDIGEEESKHYASLISKLSPLALYFSDVNLNVPSWNKLEVLKQLLTSNLATIREMHFQHMLLDFAPEELYGLITALFVDSPVRREVISIITSGQ